jgi:hypothetical protein
MNDNARDYWFAYGFKSKDAANETLENGFAAGEISPCEHPRIEAYTIGNGAERRTRYGVRVTI